MIIAQALAANHRHYRINKHCGKIILGIRHFKITIPAGVEDAAREFYCGMASILAPQRLRGIQGIGCRALARRLDAARRQNPGRHS